MTWQGSQSELCLLTPFIQHMLDVPFRGTVQIFGDLNGSAASIYYNYVLREQEWHSMLNTLRWTHQYLSSYLLVTNQLTN